MSVSVLSYSFRGLLNAGMMDVFGYLETCKYRYHLRGADLWSGFFASTDDEYVLTAVVGSFGQCRTIVDSGTSEGLHSRHVQLANRHTSCQQERAAG